MKNWKYVFWGSTGLLSLMMLMSVGMYIFNHGEVSATFQKLGYPAYIVYPLAGAKLLGLIAILTRKSKLLAEWAYAGFFFDFVLACTAHIAVGDGEWAPALVASVLLILSRFSLSKLEA